MIMIAEHRVHAAASSQATNHFRAGCGITALMRDVIARQSDNVRFQTVSCFHSPPQLGRGGKRAVMEIGKLDNAQTVQCLWQAPQKNGTALNCEHERLS